MNRLFHTLVKNTYNIEDFYFHFHTEIFLSPLYMNILMALKLLFREMKLFWRYLWDSSV